MRAHDSQQYVVGVRVIEDRVPSWDDYPFSLPAVRALDGLEFKTPVTFLIGENGVGKSTLLEAIAIAFGFNPEGGSRNFNFSSRESHSPLHSALRLIKSPRKPSDGFFLRAESFYNVASEVERLGAVRGYGDRNLHELSHGESFISLTMNRFWGDGLYILDEPEAALSPTRQLALLVRIRDLVAQRSQFIIATHSPTIEGAYDVYFTSHDRGEPPHVHVDRENMASKFWLEPVAVAYSFGFSRHELRRIERLVTANRQKCLRKWHEHFGT